MAYIDDKDPFGSGSDQYGNGETYDPYADKRWAVGEWYKNYLGRPGSAQEIEGWARNPNFGSVEQQIKNSPEAAAWLKNQQQQQTPAWQLPAIGVGSPAASAAPNPFNYEAARDSWMSGRYGVGKDAAAKWAADFGVTYDGSDTIRLPNGGGYIDIIGNFGGGAGNGQPMTNTWTPAGGNGPTPGGSAAAGGGVGSGGGGNTFAPGSQYNDLINLLVGRATQSLNIDRNDPVIRAQADAYAANEERARRNYLADLAERSSPLANLQGETRMSAERVGQRTGDFEAQLMGRELDARRQEILSALQQWGSLLTADQQMQLQRELAQIDDATKRLGINQASNQFYADLGQRANQFDRNLGLQYDELDNRMLQYYLGGLVG